MRSERDMNASVAAWTAEINKEKAGAMGMTARKLEMLLEDCAQLATQIDATTDASLRALLLADYRNKRDESEKQRWNLCVQREAMGVMHHDDVDRHYPIAPRR